MDKIFVTVGTHPQQFDRLLKEIDRLAKAEVLNGEIFAQTGYSSFEPKNFGFQKFLGLEEFEKMLSEADMVITHAGEGNIGACIKLGKKMVVVPRRKEFNEHTNDHQLELAEVVGQKKLGLVAWNPEELNLRLRELKNFRPQKVVSGRIPKILDDYVKRELRW